MRHDKPYNLMLRAEESIPVSMIDVFQQLCELQLTLGISDRLELPELLERFHVPIANLHVQGSSLIGASKLLCC